MEKKEELRAAITRLKDRIAENESSFIAELISDDDVSSGISTHTILNMRQVLALAEELQEVGTC